MIEQLHPLLGHAGGEVAGAAAIIALRLALDDLHMDRCSGTGVLQLGKGAAELRTPVAVEALKMFAARFRRDAKMPVGLVIIETGHLLAGDERMGGGGDDRADMGLHGRCLTRRGSGINLGPAFAGQCGAKPISTPVLSCSAKRSIRSALARL